MAAQDEPPIDDRILFDSWRAGDRAAGDRLYKRHYSRVARFFHNKVTDDVRDDLVQETFTACVQRPELFRGQASFRNYVLAIAWRRLMRHLRIKMKQHRHTANIDIDVLSVSDVGQSPEAGAALREEVRLLLEGLRRIPIAYQVTLELHYWEYLSATDIAKILAIPVGTAKTRLRDGRMKLETRLAEIVASSRRLASTLDNLDRWAERTRQRIPAEDSEESEP